MNIRLFGECPRLIVPCALDGVVDIAVDVGLDKELICPGKDVGNACIQFPSDRLFRFLLVVVPDTVSFAVD